jgi:integrase/recombinase XerD
VFYVPLPEFILTAPAAVPKVSERYFFWAGGSKIESATGDWQRTLKGVFDKTGISDARAHRFRDTFAVGLLQAGVPMERVSVLLGHSSIKVTERYYSVAQALLPVRDGLRTLRMKHRQECLCHWQELDGTGH